MVIITNEDWAAYEEKFGKLMHYIGRRISGDPATCCPESNFQDLSIAAINSIVGYYRKNELTLEDISVQEVIEDDNFAPWTKTILWNAKNKKGAHVTKRKNLTLSSVTLSEELVEAQSGGCYLPDEYDEHVSSVLGKLEYLDKEELDGLFWKPSTVGTAINLFGE